MDKYVVLISGGVDSTTALYYVMNGNPSAEFFALSILYGQKAGQEVNHAKFIANLKGISHKIVDLNVLKDLLKSPLTTEAIDQAKNDLTGDSFYIVPFRNAIFLSVAVGYAESIDAKFVVMGNHKDDTGGFPDCTHRFIQAFQEAVQVGSEKGKAPFLMSPWQQAHKQEIIKEGIKLGVPYEHTWSCYEYGELHCGVCESCEYRHNAFLDLGVEDPTKYKVEPRRIVK